MLHISAPWHEAGRGIFSKDGTNIAIVTHPTDKNAPHEYNTCIANAKLIAAAPDLLKICKEIEPFLRALRDYLKENEPNYDGSLYEESALTKLRMIIKRAEGK